MAVKSETKFPIEDLINAAPALGYNKYIAAGAFYGYNKKKKITRKEFIKIVEEFAKKEVK